MHTPGWDCLLTQGGFKDIIHEPLAEDFGLTATFVVICWIRSANIVFVHSGTYRQGALFRLFFIFVPLWCIHSDSLLFNKHYCHQLYTVSVGVALYPLDELTKIGLWALSWLRALGQTPTIFWYHIIHLWAWSRHSDSRYDNLVPCCPTCTPQRIQ